MTSKQTQGDRESKHKGDVALNADRASWMEK